MTPGTLSDEAGGTAEPRRSGRIAAFPAAPADAPKPNTAKGKAVNKRSAKGLDEAKEDEMSTKKAKVDVESLTMQDSSKPSTTNDSPSSLSQRSTRGRSIPRGRPIPSSSRLPTRTKASVQAQHQELPLQHSLVVQPNSMDQDELPSGQGAFSGSSLMNEDITLGPVSVSLSVEEDDGVVRLEPKVSREMEYFANLEKLSFELKKNSSNPAQYLCGADPKRSARRSEMVLLLELCHEALSPAASNADHNLLSPKSLPPDTTRIREIESLLGSLLIDELFLDKPGAFESIYALRPLSQEAIPFSLNFKIDTLKKVYSILGRVSTGTEYFNSSIEWKDGKLFISEIDSRRLDNLLSLSSDFYLLHLALGDPADLKWTIECLRQQKFLESPIVLYDVRGRSSPHLWMPDIWRIRFILNYKRLPYQTVWLEFHDVERELRKIGAPHSAVRDGRSVYTLPVIVDSTRNPQSPQILSNVDTIAEYLELMYPAHPVFPPGSRAMQTFFVYFVQKIFSKPLVPIMFPNSPQTLVVPERELAWAAVKEQFDFLAMIMDKNSGDEDRVVAMGPDVTYADFALCAVLIWIERMAARDGWARVRTWNGGRWNRLWDKCRDYMDEL